MDYPTLLETVVRHLEGLGVDCTPVTGEPISDQALASAEAEMKVRLPAELREFYHDIGDGFSLLWYADPNDLEKPWGALQVPSLSYLAELYNGWRGLVLYTPELAEKSGFPYTEDPALAKRTAARMWHWMPIIEEGSDSICLDLGDPSCPVVFDQHDWMDGGSGDNGHSLASNWGEFLLGWGSVCFQQPKDSNWMSCFRSGGGVDWDGEHFRSPFRVRSLGPGS